MIYNNNWVPPYDTDTVGNRPWGINPCPPYVRPPYVIPWVPPVVIQPPPSIVIRPRAPVRRPTKPKTRAPIRRHTMSKKTTGKKETFITLVLDRSYSMENCQQAALDSLNEQIGSIKKHAKKGGNTFVSLILFDDTIDVLYENRPVKDVSPLELSDYQLGGMTALRDAMLTAIETMQGKQNRDKNQGFLTVLISDGMENASGTPADQLKSRIQELEGTDKWTFTYMLDGHSWEEAREFADLTGVSYGNLSTYTSTSKGTVAASAAMRGATVNYLSARDDGEQSVKTFYNSGDGSESAVSE